jgi:hypothetical protein
MAKFTPTKFKGKLHYHGCLGCRRRYWDSCHQPEDDARCITCLAGHASIQHLGTAPRACCTTNCRVATKDDREQYKLAGPGPWHLCQTCYRQHPSQPRSTDVPA